MRGFPVVSPARAGAGTAAGDRSEADRRALATALVQTRLTTAAKIAAAAATTSRRVRRQVGHLVEELLARAESGPEAAIWRGQVAARMPVPLRNHPVDVRGRRLRLDG